LKIKYQFVNGEHSEFEAPDEIKTVIVSDRKAEYALEKRNRCHCYSLCAALYNGIAYD
jgi:hypothetical protein